MKILIVASFNKGRFAPFILEQVDALKDAGCQIEYYGLQGKGLNGYLKNLPSLFMIKASKYGHDGLIVKNGIYVHNNDGSYRENIKEIFK